MCWKDLKYMAGRRGSTVRFDDEVYEILEKWRQINAFPSISSLIESIVIRVLRNELPAVPKGIDVSAAQIDFEPDYSEQEKQLEQVGRALEALAAGDPLPRDICVSQLCSALGIDSDVIATLWAKTNGNRKTQQSSH